MCEDNIRMRFAEDIFGKVREAVRAIRAARSGKPLPAGDVSFFEAFSEELGLKADAPLTEAHLQNALFWSLEDDSNEELISFSTPSSIDASLVALSDQVALKVCPTGHPDEAIVLVHEDFGVYADFVLPNLFAHRFASPEKEALLSLLDGASDVLESWIRNTDMASALAAPTQEEWFDLCAMQKWRWSEWDSLVADTDNAP